MNEILSMEISQMPGLNFECSCGKRHAVEIKHIIVASGCLFEAACLAAEMRATKIFLLADDNTYAVCGKKAGELFVEKGITLCSYIFKSDTSLVPDEKALGRLLVEMSADTSLIVAVGSGTLNDLARMLSCKTHIPYFILATAPSMDGFASTVSPLIIEGFKTTYEAVAPVAIIADTSILKDAPMEMIQAGFGDILGKYTALTDWVLSREICGEYYCELSAKLMESAVLKCMENRQAILTRDETAIRLITEALILSGVAMGIVGNSRPASGAEHHISHYWEMDALKKGWHHPLHGNAVGVATVVSACIYELMHDQLPAACKPPKPEAIVKMLQSVGAHDNPSALGVSRELFHETILHAMEIRDRYTILRFANDKGRLPEISDLLTRRFYSD
jgi:glycerol-1-phosphate dehydrogenase [NAD(P)+]